MVVLTGIWPSLIARNALPNTACTGAGRGGPLTCPSLTWWDARKFGAAPLMNPTTCSQTIKHGISWAWETINVSASRCTWTRPLLENMFSDLSTLLNPDNNRVDGCIASMTSPPRPDLDVWNNLKTLKSPQHQQPSPRLVGPRCSLSKKSKSTTPKKIAGLLSRTVSTIVPITSSCTPVVWTLSPSMPVLMPRMILLPSTP
mmetsp:Transcript_11927/g.24548  ORF Transcript_11927/g.24548 Transcript_11927/m.24548 type:complete len:201 (-) Transcript_11927:1237-1839(-)